MSCKIIFAFVLITAGIATAFPYDEPARTGDVIDEPGEHEITRETAEALHDVNGEEKRGMEAADKIAGAQLAVDILGTVLDAIQNVARKVAIGLDNESGETWMRGTVYYQSGTSDAVLPYKLENGKALLFPARKTAGPVARGAVGVMCWCTEANSYSICVMYSVPYDYNWYSNWWNVKRYAGCKKAAYNVYKDLYYYANPFKGDSSWKGRYLGRGLKMRGSMSPSGDSTLEIHVERA